MYLDNNSKEGATRRLTELKDAMDGLVHSPSISMRMTVGWDITCETDDLLPLDNFLLDADVVEIVKTCHDDVLKDGSFFANDDLWHCFFRVDRDIDDVKALFDV